MSEEESTLNLQALQEACPNAPWSLTFSYGRALQVRGAGVDGGGENRQWGSSAAALRDSDVTCYPALPHCAALPRPAPPRPAPLQSATLKAWSGNPANWDKAQAILVSLAKANSGE